VHPAFPAPSLFEGDSCNNPDASRRGNADPYLLFESEVTSTRRLPASTPTHIGGYGPAFVGPIREDCLAYEETNQLGQLI
jgi:hypothetical protein